MTSSQPTVSSDLPQATAKVRRSWPLFDRDEVEEVTRVLERLEVPYILTFTSTPGPGGFSSTEWTIQATITGERVDSVPPVEDTPE
jgi:hypothetical protein